jgi:hypothetical protein
MMAAGRSGVNRAGAAIDASPRHAGSFAISMRRSWDPQGVGIDRRPVTQPLAGVITFDTAGEFL